MTGCSWDVADRITDTSESTLRRRRDEWVAAGVFWALVDEALAGYDRIIGLELGDLVVDCPLPKAPSGGEATGPSPADRGTPGWKWSVATDARGIPVAWVPTPANQNDCTLSPRRATPCRGVGCSTTSGSSISTGATTTTPSEKPVHCAIATRSSRRSARTASTPG